MSIRGFLLHKAYRKTGSCLGLNDKKKKYLLYLLYYSAFLPILASGLKAAPLYPFSPLVFTSSNTSSGCLPYNLFTVMYL